MSGPRYLLEDPNSNLHTLAIPGNEIDILGLKTLANGLTNNTKLKQIYLNNNPIDQTMTGDTFCTLLCNTSSVNSTYLSNHTLETVLFNY